MKNWLMRILERTDRTEYYLYLANILLVFFLVAFDKLNFIRLGIFEYGFLLFLVLAFAVYRPKWAFWLFIGSIVLESVNLAPAGLGIGIRPYQLLAGLLMIALFFRYLGKRGEEKWLRLTWIDYAIFLIPLSGLINVIIHSQYHSGLKFVLILFSFSVIFVVTRYFTKNLIALKKTLPFILGSSLVVLFFGFWQNLRFAHGLNSFSVMPGRPNSSFPEPDWLGFYLVIILSFCYVVLYFLNEKYVRNQKGAVGKFLPWFIYLTAVISLLIITVSRSAWLGAAALTIVFLVYVFTNFKLEHKKWNWPSTIRLKLFILASILFSFALVYAFHLTTFQLFNRVQSVGTGDQKITISCLNDVSVPKKIATMGELDALGCRQINLEEISAEKTSGRFVKEVLRDDPNVNIRAEVYGKTWQAITSHPILGIGWENIPIILGRDGRGAELNTSNIFLEAWLGGGIVSLLALLGLFFLIVFRACQKLIAAKSLELRSFALFVVISWIGLVIFNLFNAGIMLGFFWVWLGISSGIIDKTNENRN